MTKTTMDLLKVTEHFTSALEYGLPATSSETGQDIPALTHVFNQARKDGKLHDIDQRTILRIYRNALQKQKVCVDEIAVMASSSLTPFSTIENAIEKHAAEIISTANELAKAVLIPNKLYSGGQLRALMGPENRTQENYESFTAMGWQADFLAKLCQP